MLCFLETIATETAPKSAPVKGNLVERAFGKRLLFADSPTARAIAMRIGDPALMLLKPDAHFDGERLVCANILGCTRCCGQARVLVIES